MSRSAGNSWRAKANAAAMLLPLLTLSACGNSNDQQMAEKLAAAEAAAEKAIAAQHAAEKAAATAASIRPAPAQAPVTVSDLSPHNDWSDDNGDNGDTGHDSNDDPLLTGGEG